MSADPWAGVQVLSPSGPLFNTAVRFENRLPPGTLRGGLAALFAAQSHRITRGAPPPFTPLPKPLAACRLALVSTAGVHLRTDSPFDVPHDDPTFRVIPSQATAADLAISHDHYPRDAAVLDLNVVFPLGRLQELAAAGVIGGLTPAHISFQGVVPFPRRLLSDTGPAALRRLQALGTDAVLLTGA